MQSQNESRAVIHGTIDVCFTKHIGPEDGQSYWPDPELRDGEEIEVAPDVTATRLTHELRKMVSEACQPRGYGLLGPSPGDVLTYGFVRRQPRGGSFDEDEKLTRLVALSRLIHPSAHGFDYCATIHFNPDGTVNAIFGAPGHLAYKTKEDRPWLTPQDIRDLSQLFLAYEALPVLPEPPPVHLPLFAEPAPSSRKLPRRLHRALWNMAYASGIQPSHLRWLIISTSAEGLIETGSNGRQEFITRLPAISTELGRPISRKDAEMIYGLRSRVAHTGWLTTTRTDEELDASFVQLDRFVAGVLRRAIEDARFRGAFESRESVAARWPVEPASELM